MSGAYINVHVMSGGSAAAVSFLVIKFMSFEIVGVVFSIVNLKILGDGDVHCDQCNSNNQSQRRIQFIWHTGESKTRVTDHPPPPCAISRH
jgi:hypothetical protein